MGKELTPAEQSQKIKDKIIADKKAESEARAKEEKAIADATVVDNGKKKEKAPSKAKKEKKEKKKVRKERRKAEQRAAIEKIRAERKAAEENYF